MNDRHATPVGVAFGRNRGDLRSAVIEKRRTSELTVRVVRTVDPSRCFRHVERELVERKHRGGRPFHRFRFFTHRFFGLEIGEDTVDHALAVAGHGERGGLHLDDGGGEIGVAPLAQRLSHRNTLAQPGAGPQLQGRDGTIPVSGRPSGT